MGSTESSEGRRVSFGVDEEERVRVLQGVRLSENVVNRMKEPSSPPPAPAPSTFGLQDGDLRAPHKESTLPRSGSSGGQQPSGTKEGVKRYEQEHAAVQDKLFQVAKREREAATKHSKTSLPMGEGSISHEEQKSVRLQARELESKEAELRRRDTFYKEQLERIERKNAEMYKLSSQQFHEAASKMESTIKPRRVEPVCSGLQAQILHCYRDRLHEVLLCSDLVKAYQRCVSAAHKG
ncbi:MICOS complex subunit MIC25 isoform X3 [Pongo pygmaeus]|uniref:MICOS complex subunit MIC25 isoform X3 n=1 Tax=Pongo pygmaeus TaxID=9600 RepID=UPI0023E152C7|nr:MICOS complex subunit MIC25 isoform X6 [Pongo abelii]XP_054336781.1 MICOS complex subunit MIC25 isoform X1 [Pongo pygmaeus]